MLDEVPSVRGLEGVVVAETRLSRLGLDLVNYKEIKSRQKNVTGRGIRRTDLITFCFHLEQLVRAGVPILEGLADLRDTIDNRRLREVTAAMIESIFSTASVRSILATICPVPPASSKSRLAS